MAQKARHLRWLAAYGLLSALLAVLLALNLGVGSVDVAALLADPDGAGTAARILWQIRLPRLLSAALLGGALALAGFLLQTFFGNPIAGPFVLGISSGAKLTVALTIIFALGRGFVLGSGALVLAAFAGSLLCMGFVLLVSARVKRMSVLIVCGVMVGYICSAVTDFAVTFADDANIVNLHNWSLGSFSGASWSDLRLIVPLVAAALVCTLLLAKPMAAWQLGEVCAVSLGVNVPRFRAVLILLSSLLAACVTAFAGPVSFVGIAVPHLVRRLLGTSRPLVVFPACFLGGAVFCLFCDMAARTAFAPTELSISSVTAVLGAPVVIVMLLQRRKEAA